MNRIARRQSTKSAAALGAALLAFGCAACGSGTPSRMDPSTSRMRAAAQRSPDLDSENGLWIDVFRFGGLVGSSDGEVLNGMPPNLLAINGLGPAGVSTDAFLNWFATDPVVADLIMKYLVRCSLPAEATISYTYADVLYVWQGALGLAPAWASDLAIPELEQQLVSACLAAHANKYGMKVPVSILGRLASGGPIPVAETELADYPITEGCFFGNLFTSEGVFSATDRPVPLTDAESSSRACALADRSGVVPPASSNCPPLIYAGSCRDVCQPSVDGLFYESCTVNGLTYRPLTTRNKPTALYTCGDGICNISESCGLGVTWDSCGLDCGPCP